MAESTTTRVRFEPLPRSCFVAVSSVADCAEVAHEVVKRARVASVRTPRCRQKHPRAAGI